MSLIRRLWRVGRWVLFSLCAAFVVLVLFRIPVVLNKQKSDEAVAFIKAQKLTMADVDGKHLPPPPDPAQVDATVAGIDANQNGIRDDVELAIFAKYPNDIKLRAAELQYAMGLQTFITKVFDHETWKVAAVEVGRGDLCISGTYPRTNLSEFNKITHARTQEVEDLMLNTSNRKLMKNVSESYITSYGLPDGDFCDINVTGLGS